MKRLLLIFVATLLIVGVVSATVTKTETVDGNYTVIKWTTDLAAGGGQDSTTWDVPARVTEIEYLVVAGGGGGGGYNSGGGGGAGGLLTGSGLAVSGTETIKIGAGGSGGTVNTNGGNGSNTYITNDGATIEATGGGGGGGGRAGAGSNGGSGGGNGDNTPGTPGQGVDGQGYDGAPGVLDQRGGGGGGASEAGSTDAQGYGGDGAASSITGTSVTYAGGGGGGDYSGGGGNGGDGGGGNGGGSGATGANATGYGSGGGGGGGGNGGSGSAGVVIVRFLTPPPMSITANFTASNTSGIKPLLVTFADTSTTTNATIDSWAWDFGDGNISSSQNPSHTYEVPGTHTANLTITNTSYSLVSTKLVTITVYKQPAADFSSFNTQGTAPFTTYFYDLSTNLNAGPYTYYTDFGDGNTSTSEIAIHTYNMTGTFTVNHSVTDSVTTAWKNVTGYITVGSPVVAPIASFYGGPQLGAPPLKVFFTDVSSNTPTSWNWSFGDGTFSESQNPAHWFNRSGFYRINLTVTNDAGSNLSSQKNFVMTY